MTPGDVAIAIQSECAGGKGGFAAVIKREGQPRLTIITGGNPKTTANRTELAAVIEALRHLNKNPEPGGAAVRIDTASTYLCHAFTKGWLDKWQTNGWKNKQGKDVSNRELWKELQQELKDRAPEWNLVPETDPDCRRLAQEAQEAATKNRDIWVVETTAPALAATEPKGETVAGVNAVQQALWLHQEALEYLGRAWRLSQEQNQGEIGQAIQEAMNRLERQRPNLERAVHGLSLLEQATG